MKTVHGPDAHVTKKQRNDVHVRAPLLKENGDNEASAEPGGRGPEESVEASSTSHTVEDCLHIKAIKTESSGVRQSWCPAGRAQLFSSARGPEAQPPLEGPARTPLSQNKMMPHLAAAQLSSCITVHPLMNPVSFPSPSLTQLLLGNESWGWEMPFLRASLHRMCLPLLQYLGATVGPQPSLSLSVSSLL